MKRAAIFLSLIALAVFRGTESAGNGDAAIPLNTLMSGQRIAFHSIYEIVDVKVGSISVWRLLRFSEPDRKFKRVETTIKVADRKALAELRTLLLKQESPALTIELTGTGTLQWMNDLFGRIVRREWQRHPTITLRVLLDETPCERVKRVIYQSIDDTVGKAFLARETKADITLDSLFKLLIKERLVPYMENELEPVKNHPCFENFLLYKWIKGEQARGFEYKKYDLNPELREILDHIAKALLHHKTLVLYHYELDVVGYTDSDAFLKHPKLPLRASATGVQQLRDPLRIFYAGCSDDRVTGPEPAFIPRDAVLGTPVGTSLENNCELSAVRAYVAMTVLSSALGTDRATYRYASGGIAKGELSAAASRKVEVRIRVKAGDQE